MFGDQFLSFNQSPISQSSYMRSIHAPHAGSSSARSQISQISCMRSIHAPHADQVRVGGRKKG
eukprot:5400317-Prymnesium_polylepis.1